MLPLMEEEVKNYKWEQKINEIHIYFNIDPNEKGRNITFKIVGKNIKITYNGRIILEGELLNRMVAGSDYWVINGDVVDFYFDKQKNEWWDSLLVGSEKVDTSKLAENSNLDFSTMDPECREILEKMAIESKGPQSVGLPPNPYESSEKAEDLPYDLLKEQSDGEQQQDVSEVDNK